MLHEVRVFGPAGNLKNVVSSKSLSRRHWNDFNESEKDMSFNKAKRVLISKSIKQQLDVQFSV